MRHRLLLPALLAASALLASGCYLHHEQEGGVDPTDGGGRDAGWTADAARPDAARLDASRPDASTPDASIPDADRPDAFLPDAGPLCPPGTPCDDGDPCTGEDRCTVGEFCEGIPIACVAPPPPTCLDSGTLREHEELGACVEGACVYTPVDRACPEGCAAGACLCVPVPWRVETLYEGTSSTSRVGLAVEPSGRAHVAYYESFSRGLVYRARDSVDLMWSDEVIAPMILSPRLAVDPSGTPHVIAFAASVPEIVHAERQPGGWVVRTALGGSHTGEAMGLVSDPMGGLHAAYLDTFSAGNRDLGYLSRPAGGSWTEERIDELGDTGINASIALDPRGAVHMGYQHGVHRTLHHVHESGGTWPWNFEDVDLTGDALGPTSMQIDSTGRILLLYTRGAAGAPTELRIGERRPGRAWSTSPVAASTRGGALAIDGSNVVHVAYLRDDALYYARQAAGGGPWVEERVTPVERTPGSPEIAVDARGGIHIAFRDRFSSRLRYAYRRDCP